ncbi:hypothetical protein ACJIZ3_010103 [Penstemon smallii]|uniref:CASP-like protein n=1 Tax=Penstemon smallii TaxID=265156 RepID=A0ABD3TED1_9LAMI
MASTINKSPENHSSRAVVMKTHKFYFVSQISLRCLAIFATLTATWIMLTTKQTTVVFGIQLDARYNYSSAFKFFAFANLIACVFSVLSLFLAFILSSKEVDPTYYFYTFLHDLIVLLLLMAGCAAATAVGYIGKYGNNYTGWMPICDHFAKFCHKIIFAALLSYFGILLYLILTIISANKSRQIQV